jgi:hypothetical protein
VDLDGEGYKSMSIFMQKWHRDAQKNGIEWVNHSSRSAMKDFCTNDWEMDIADAMLMLQGMGALA